MHRTKHILASVPGAAIIATCLEAATIIIMSYVSGRKSRTF